MALMATEPKVKVYACRGWDGVDPGRTFHFPPPDGTDNIEDYVKAGWDEPGCRGLHERLLPEVQYPLQFPYLRIPGTFEYWQALDVTCRRRSPGRRLPKML